MPTAFAAQPRRLKTMLANQTASPGLRVHRGAERRALPEPPAPAAARRRRRSTSGTSTSRWRSTRTGSPTRATSRSSSSAASISPTMKPLVERYLGSLPSIHRQGDVEGRRRAHADDDRREDGREGHRAQEPGRDRLHRTVRVQPDAARRDPRDGGDSAARGCSRRFARIWAAPTASARARATRRSRSPSTRSAIDFGCDPKRTDDLIKRVFEEIEKFKTQRSDREAGHRREGGAAEGLRQPT